MELVASCDTALKLCHTTQLVSWDKKQKRFSPKNSHFRTMTLVTCDSVYIPGYNTYSFHACKHDTDRRDKRHCLCHKCIAIMCILLNLFKQRQMTTISRHSFSWYRSLKGTINNSLPHSYNSLNFYVLKSLYYLLIYIYTPSVFCYDKHKKNFDIQFSMKRHETV